MGNTLEPLSLHLGGGRPPVTDTPPHSAKWTNRAQGYRRKEGQPITGDEPRQVFLCVLGPGSPGGVSERLLMVSEQKGVQ